jgi:hypothetical protein
LRTRLKYPSDATNSCASTAMPGAVSVRLKVLPSLEGTLLLLPLGLKYAVMRSPFSANS